MKIITANLLTVKIITTDCLTVKFFTKWLHYSPAVSALMRMCFLTNNGLEKMVTGWLPQRQAILSQSRLQQRIFCLLKLHLRPSASFGNQISNSSQRQRLFCLFVFTCDRLICFYSLYTGYLYWDKYVGYCGTTLSSEHRWWSTSITLLHSDWLGS